MIETCSRCLTALCALLLASTIIGGCAVSPPETEPAPPPPAVDEEETPIGPSAETIIQEATQAAQNNRYEEASLMLEELIGREPGNLVALRLLARIYAAGGDAFRSSATWEKVHALDASDPDAAYEAGSILAERGNWQKVRSMMLSVESSGRADSRHFLLLGRADQELGYRKESERYLQKASGLELADALLGELYYGSGRMDEAESAFKRALGANPGNFTANLHLGYISYSRGELAAAKRHYQRACDSDPADPLACLSLASLYEKMEQPAKAIDLYSKAVGLSKTPKSEKKRIYISLSRLLVENGRLEEAISIIKDGLSLFPSSGGLYFYWGEALLKKGLAGEAKERYLTAAKDPAWEKPSLARFHSIR